MSVDLSIVIVNWNTRDLLAQCLESVDSEQLTANSEPSAATGHQPLSNDHRSLSTETIVVDNASTDGSAALVREQFTSVWLIENQRNVGFARANNQARALCQGRYVLLLNSDTVVHPGALAAMVAFMDAHPKAGACGARLLNSDGTLQASCHPMLTPGREFWRLIFLERLLPRATYRMDRWNIETPRQVEVIKGACLLLRQAALDQVGSLDESYFMYTEEVDLCYRLAQAGWTLWYVPAAVVTHFGEASSRQVREEMYLQLYRSKIQFYRKFGGEPRAQRFVHLLQFAYRPRWLFTRVLAPFSSAMTNRSNMYGRLLAELAKISPS